MTFCSTLFRLIYQLDTLARNKTWDVNCRNSMWPGGKDMDLVENVGVYNNEIGYMSDLLQKH